MTAAEVETIDGVDLHAFDPQYLKRASIPELERDIILNKINSQVILLPNHGTTHIVSVKPHEVDIMDALVEDPKRDIEGLIIEETLRISHHTLLDYMSELRGRFRQVRETVIYSGYSRYSGRFSYALRPYTPHFYVKVPHLDLDRLIEIPHQDNGKIAFTSSRYDYTRYVDNKPRRRLRASK